MDQLSHGKRRYAGYGLWRQMHYRCNTSTAPEYRNYGARGIKVCPEWKSFERFIADMGERPPKHQLDRIDNDGGYSKENCRWVLQKVNLNNKRTNRRIEYKGRIQTIAQWAEELNIHYRTLNNRLNRGWTVERAFTEPVHLKE
jgi:hypothetical protein